MKLTAILAKSRCQHSYAQSTFRLQTSSFATERDWSHVEPTKSSVSLANPIRNFFDGVASNKYSIAQDKSLISLAIGDPTKYMGPPKSVFKALQEASSSEDWSRNSYCNSNGAESARTAVCSLYNRNFKNSSSSYYRPQDVFMTGGCQQALDICFSTLLQSGSSDHVLIPQPGWPEYEANCDRHGFGYKYYRCDPSNAWQVDLDHLESLVDDNTRAILTTSPSNPCGSVLSYDTMLAVLQLAERYKIPIISDEIYSNLVFDQQSHPFVSYAEIKRDHASVSDVPVFVCSGLAKNYMLPGWKVGWLLLDGPTSARDHAVTDMKGAQDTSDAVDVLGGFRKAALNLLTVNFGPSSLCQSMVETILNETDEQYWSDINNRLSNQNRVFCELINEQVDGLTAIPASGAFYVMVKIDMEKFENIETDVEFFEKLLAEQAVFIMPGSCFKMQGYFRAVICASESVLIEVVDRLNVFCKKYATKVAKL